ncbi:hypothetical protein K438DRAFT_1777743 [Mycena galopus ATCC 62051]|nr:hypothetical protein K438DRAFT_1777743 [Mycena galopus ATCC 62051]
MAGVHNPDNGTTMKGENRKIWKAGSRVEKTGEAFAGYNRWAVTISPTTQEKIATDKTHLGKGGRKDRTKNYGSLGTTTLKRGGDVMNCPGSTFSHDTSVPLTDASASRTLNTRPRDLLTVETRSRVSTDLGKRRR